MGMKTMEEKLEGSSGAAVVGVAPESEMTTWLSTYGLITVEKLLDRYGMKLSPEDLSRALRNMDCIYFRIIQVPLKNIFNGLIFQQAKDYQAYAQKLYIDYLLSSGAEEDESQACEDLETSRQELVELGESFAAQELAHERLIARSQAFLIQYAKNYVQRLNQSIKKIKQALQKSGVIIHDDRLLLKVVNTLLSDYHPHDNVVESDVAWQRVDRLLNQPFDLTLRALIADELLHLNKIDAETEATIEDYREQTVVMAITLKRFRSDFSSIIIKTNELISMVTRYHVDEQQLVLNQADLYFDGTLGDEKA